MKTKTSQKKLLALLLSLVLVLGMIPLAAFAAEGDVVPDPSITVEITDVPTSVLKTATEVKVGYKGTNTGNVPLSFNTAIVVDKNGNNVTSYSFECGMNGEASANSWVNPEESFDFTITYNILPADRTGGKLIRKYTQEAVVISLYSGGKDITCDALPVTVEIPLENPAPSISVVPDPSLPATLPSTTTQIAVEYTITNTGNVPVSCNRYYVQERNDTTHIIPGDTTYSVVTPSDDWSWVNPGASIVSTVTYKVQEADVTAGNLKRAFTYLAQAIEIEGGGGECSDTAVIEISLVDDAPELQQIEAVAVTGVTAPIAGEAASLAFTVPADAGYSKQDRGDGFGIWKEFDHNPTAAEISAAVPKDLPFSFVGGNYYVFTAYVEAKEGFCFGTETIPATMNGAPAAYEQIHSKSANVIGTFYCELPTVDSIAVESVVTPVVGEECSFGYALPTDANYEDYMGTCGWVESTTPPPASLADSEDWDDWAYNNKTDSASNGAGQSITFRAGYYYTFVLIVQPKTGYKFADSVSATVNGQTAKFLPEGSALHDRVIYTFGPLSEDGGSGEDPIVDNVAINDVVAPSVGAASDFAFSLPSGAHYTNYVEGGTDVCLWVESDTAPGSLADSAAWNTWCGSNQTALARPMDTPISFQSGKYYTFLVCVEPEDGYTWADTVSATVNGETAQFLKVAGEFVDCVIYTFGPLSEDGGSGEDPTTPETDTVLIPLWKNVAGGYAPAEEFSFSVVDGNSQPFTDLNGEGPTITGATIKTEGVGSYSGLITIWGTVEEIAAVKQLGINIKENSKSGWDCDATEYIMRWNYDDNRWYMFDPTGIEVIRTFEDYGEPLEQLEFTNTYVGEEPGTGDDSGTGEQPGEGDDSGTGEQPVNPNLPKTGDNSNVALWIALMLAAAMGVAAATLLGKSRKGKYSK